MSQEQDVKQEQQPYAAGMAAKLGVKFTLTVHLDDGTTKDIECVGQITAVEKE